MRMTMNREVDLGKEPVKHLLFILAVPAIMLMCGKVTNKNLIDSHPTIPLVHIVIWKD